MAAPPPRPGTLRRQASRVGGGLTRTEREESEAKREALVETATFEQLQRIAADGQVGVVSPATATATATAAAAAAAAAAATATDAASIATDAASIAAATVTNTSSSTYAVHPSREGTQRWAGADSV